MNPELSPYGPALTITSVKPTTVPGWSKLVASRPIKPLPPPGSSTLVRCVPLALTVAFGGSEGHLRFAGLNLYQLNLGTAVGDVEIDLRGQWPRSFAVVAEGGLGEMVVRLPSDMGVRVFLEEEDSKILMDGLTQMDEYYVNDAWGKTMATIELTVDADDGEIRLEVEP